MHKKINIYVLTASGSLVSYRRKIEKIALDLIKKVESRIPLPDIDLIFADNPHAVIPELGIGGHTYGPNLVFISLDPSFKDFDLTIEKELPRTLAHELNHCARWKKTGYGSTLLEAMISEGLADHFDEEISKGEPRVWSKALNPKQINRFLELAKEDFHNKNYNHTDWFFGSKTRKIPKWTGYSLGYYLVGQYLKRNSGKNPSDIYNLTASQFIKSDGHHNFCMKKYIFKQYNPIFPELYKKEQQRLKQILGDKYLIEHIGSTAVPNLGGKGIIDIMISVPRKLMNQISQLLQKRAGYEFSASGGDEERLFHQQDRYHVHVTFPESESRKRVVAFRDYLIQHPKDLKRYAQIKQKAATQAKGDRDTYLKVKQTIIDKIIQKAYAESK